MVVTSLFDHLGLVSPLTIQIKKLFQKLWTAKSEYNETISPGISQQWEQLVESVFALLVFPRHVTWSTDKLVLHVFSRHHKLLMQQ